MDKIIEQLKRKAGDLMPVLKQYRPKKEDSKFLLNLLWLLPVLVVVLVIKMNLMPFGGSVSFNMDVGAGDTEGAAVLTGPFDRISDGSTEGGVSIRELEGGPVYFTLDNNALGRAGRVEVTVRFAGDFPVSSSLMVGAKAKENGGYLWEYVYSPFYEQVSEMPLVTKNDSVWIYATDEENPPDFVRVDDFTGDPPLGSVAASNNPEFGVDQETGIDEFPGIEVLDFDDGEPLYSTFVNFKPVDEWLESDTVMAGPHDFYFHTDGGDVEINAGKRDRNYFEGLDNVHMTVYTLDGVAVASHTIPDDFNLTDDRELGHKQFGDILVQDMDRGTYRLEIRSSGDDADFIITYLSINCGGMVTPGPLYLAGNTYVGKDPGAMWAWCYMSSPGEIRFKTTEAVLPQYVTVYSGSDRQWLFMDKADEWYETDTLQPGIYRIKVSAGDIAVDAPQGVFALAGDALFVPSLSGAAYKDGRLSIDNALRGGHTFWTYVDNGALQLEVSKRDLNWYEGADDLSIEVYSQGGALAGNTSLPDDGNAGDSTEMGPVQSGALSVANLSDGAYRIEMAGGEDLLITGIKLNQEKLVVEGSVFLAGMSPAYFGEDGFDFGGAGLYGCNFGPRHLSLSTLHSTGLQQAAIVGRGYMSSLDIAATHTSYLMNAYAGPYCLIAPGQDIKVEMEGYLSFTPESFFYPQRCEIIDLQYNMNWIRSNVDYVVMDYGHYMVPLFDGGWLIGRATWEADDLDIVDNKLTFCINAPYLTQSAYADSTVSIDWINIKLIAEPFWRR
jgi:hypothetical protein